MDKPYFRQLFDPQLENPILVEGLTGLGNIGMIAARHLIEFTDAKVFAELYSPYFPDYVIVKKDGTCRPPRYQFYAAKTQKNHYIILTGDAQPSMEDTLAHYDICDEILGLCTKTWKPIRSHHGRSSHLEPSKRSLHSRNIPEARTETPQQRNRSLR